MQNTYFHGLCDYGVNLEAPFEADSVLLRIIFWDRLAYYFDFLGLVRRPLETNFKIFTGLYRWRSYLFRYTVSCVCPAAGYLRFEITFFD